MTLAPALDQILALLEHYGLFAVFFGVAVESAGAPFPGETLLLAAAVASGAHAGPGALPLPGVIAAAAAGAMFGDNLGYWIGRGLGLPLLERYGPRIGLSRERLAIGERLFRDHGGKIVFFGRFVAFLRAYAALLAGAMRLDPGRFFLFNAAAAIVWASLFGVLGHVFGKEAHRLTGPVGFVGLALAAAFFTFIWRFYKTQEARLRAQGGPPPSPPEDMAV
ncbi:DedA family protein [Methylocella sp.]|uniref:DedA family protein n=1 Tax=Methylocella sp. TaxID=1978226 RepID=UPI00378357C4